MVNPATTARIVANATAEMNAKKTSPAKACANSGALMLMPPFDEIALRPTIVAAPKPKNVVIM